METLLVGNMVMILFWIFMTLIANDAEKYKVIVLLYIITYLVNILKFEYRNFEKIYFTITGLKKSITLWLSYEGGLPCFTERKNQPHPKLTTPL